MGLCPLNYIRACAFPRISAHIHALCRGRYWTEFRRDLSLHPSLHHCENKLMECPGYRKDKNRKTLKNAGETPCLCETQCCSTHKNAGKTSMCPNPVHTVLKIEGLNMFYQLMFHLVLLLLVHLTLLFW